MSERKSVVPHEILKRHFKKLQKQNRSFSLRALSAKLEVSHSFMSRIMNGQAKVPLALLDGLIEALKIDAIDATNLRLAFEKKIYPVIAVSQGAQDTSEYENQPLGHLKVMRKWWNLAILDLLTCELNTPLTVENLHVFLPVPQTEIEESVRELMRLGLIETEGRKLVKSSTKVRFPALGPNEYTKAFYLQTLSLAAAELKRSDQESYQNRSILGFTCAVNSKNIPAAKQKLAAALRECAEALSEGECDEVFIVQGQMFSLLRR